jgi:hypothetical protein
MGQPSNARVAHQSVFKLNGVGITKVSNGSSALSVNSETESGRDKIIAQILSQPGAKEEGSLKPIGSLAKGDKIVSLPYKGKQIPIVVQYVGEIVAY